MKKIVLLVMLTATLAALARAEMTVNITSQSFSEQAQPIGVDGWRVLADADMAGSPSNGWERLSRKFVQHPSLANNAIEQVVDRPIAPSEVASVAFDNGWSLKVLPDGAAVRWMHKSGPYDPVADSEQEAAAEVIARTNAVDLVALKATITNDIAQTEVVISNLTVKIAALPSGDLKDVAKLCKDLAQELKDSKQVEKKLRKSLAQSAE